MKIFGASLFFLLSLHVQAAPLASVYGDIFKQVDQTRLLSNLKSMSFERYSPQGKAQFRKFWSEYYRALGLPVNELAYTTHENNGETQGHNLESVLKGSTPDSVIIIVHYDSIGPKGAETSNPGVDDDMTGMAVQLETARILSAYSSHLHYTVRFVAVDYEEWGDLEGSRKYAQYIQDLAARENFKIIAGIDDEQSGWNCAREGKCLDGVKVPQLLIDDCSNDGKYASHDFSQKMIAVAQQFSSLPVITACAGEDSDHYSLWEIGVTALEFGESSYENNDHFDEAGGDTFDKIDPVYFFSIAQIGVTFAASIVQVN